jgi:hypothetical protein
LVDLLPEAFVLVDAEAFVVEARLLLLVAARFLVEATVAVLPDVFLVLFLTPREVADFFEADRPLLDFRAADPFRAFVVGILSFVSPCLLLFTLLVSGKDPRRDRELMMTMKISAKNVSPRETGPLATRQHPFITEEALPVVDYALVFSPGHLRRPAKLAIFSCFRQTLS